MKALNNMKFLCEATTEFNRFLAAIDNADTYETARKAGLKAIGYLDCMVTYLNCMICAENNCFTGELDEQLDEMQASIYQHMACKASATDQDSELVLKLLRARDEIRGELE